MWLLMTILAGCDKVSAAKWPVEISEVVSDNELSYVQEGRGLHDWIELHNTGSSSVSLAGWYLTDKYDALDKAKPLPKIVLEPDGYCVLYADKVYDGDDYFCLSFGISRQGETLYLFDPSGEQVCSLSVPALETDVSWAKGADGVYGYCLTPTPGKGNTAEIVRERPEVKQSSAVTERSPYELYINEVSSVSAGAETDWIELYNPGDRDVDLVGFSLSDAASNPRKGELGALSVPARGYLLIPCGRDADPATGVTGFSISSGGEQLSLWDDQGLLIDTVDVPQLQPGVVYARGEQGQYGYCLTQTPGAANAAEILSEMPAAATAADKDVSSLTVRINEVSSVSAKGETDWIELFNYGDADVAIGGLFLSDSDRNLGKGTLPDVTIPAGGYLAVPCGEGADDRGGVPALNISSRGEKLYLSYEAEIVIDSVTVPALRSGVVYARGANGAFGYSGEPTPGEKNADTVFAEALRPMGADSPIRLSEGLFRNRYSAIDAYGDHSDWVELVNVGNTAVSLKGYYLSDEEDDLEKWAFPDVELAPGAYLVVFLTGKASVGNELHASFSVSDADDGCVLYRASTLEYQTLPCPNDLKDNISVGFDENGGLVYYNYPTPGYANAQGFSVQQASAFPIGDVLISEVSAGGTNGEWIELVNQGGASVDISGWYLSDDSKKLKKCPIENVSLSAGGFCVIDLDKKGEEPFFSVAMSGEELLLTDPDGVVRDVFATGALKSGMTSGRLLAEEPPRRVFFTTPTKGAQNSASYLEGTAPVPVFSETGLYQSSPFALTMSTADPRAIIHYTLDGSKPGKESQIYSDPIQISKNLCVRAICVLDGKMASEEASATYLFSAPHTLPVVCVCAEPARWTALTKVPGNKSGLEEQEARLSFYEANGTLGTSFAAGISPRGNTSIRYPHKSLSVHLRSRYGDKSVIYPFWGEGSALAYRFLILRNGSQDWKEARLRDSFASRAVAGMHLMAARTRPVVVYVNGVYYGLMDLNEGMNQDFLTTRYGVDGDTVNIVQQNDIEKHGSNRDYLKLRQFASQKDLSKADNYEAFCQRVDMDAIIDYVIAQSFFGNYDIHNQNWWGTSDGRIKWQPYLYDLDRCLDERSYSISVLHLYFSKSAKFGENGDKKIYMEIYNGLRKNKDWSKRAAERYAQLLCTDLSEERLSALLDEIAGEMRPEMAAHIKQWGSPKSLQKWEANVKQMHKLISDRYKYIIPKIKSVFGVSDAEWNAWMEKYRSA